MKSYDDDDSGEEYQDPNHKDYIIDEEDRNYNDDGVSEENLMIQSCLDDDVDQFEEAPESCFVPRKKKWSNSMVNIKSGKSRSELRNKVLDDGDVSLYRKRMAKYRLYMAEEKLNTDEQYNEIHQINEHLCIPKRIWDRLFTHQQEAFSWLWQWHVDLCGGIIGDEMGLGKTIQVIAFLVALKHTNYREVGHLYRTLGPVLLICPATVMHQWVYEFQTWWPEFRVAILHNSSTYRGGDKKKLVQDMFKIGGILITTYQGVCQYEKLFIDLSWHYVILDEGHKIRNPEAQVTHYCKLVSINSIIINLLF